MATVIMLLGAGLGVLADQDNEAAKGTAVHTRVLGVEFADGESKVRRAVIATRTPYGFLVTKVAKDSAAAKSGWRHEIVIAN